MQPEPISMALHQQHPATEPMSVEEFRALTEALGTMLGANRCAWVALAAEEAADLWGYEITSGAAIEITPAPAPASTTPRGLCVVANDRERLGRMSWMPGAS